MTSRWSPARSPILAYSAVRKVVNHGAPLPPGLNGQMWKIECYLVIHEMRQKKLSGRVLDRSFTHPMNSGTVSWRDLRSKSDSSSL